MSLSLPSEGPLRFFEDLSNGLDKILAGESSITCGYCQYLSRVLMGMSFPWIQVCHKLPVCMDPGDLQVHL
jgi:hypothetical protein